MRVDAFGANRLAEREEVSFGALVLEALEVMHLRGAQESRPGADVPSPGCEAHLQVIDGHTWLTCALVAKAHRHRPCCECTPW